MSCRRREEIGAGSTKRIEQPCYTSLLPLVHDDVENCCPHCEYAIRKWARKAGIDPDLIVWESCGLNETPIRVMIDHCDQLSIRKDR